MDTHRLHKHLIRRCCTFLSQDVKNGLENGKLVRGKLRINARRPSTAFVSAEGGVLPSDIFLDGQKSRNRAQEGDVVRAQGRN